MNISTLVFKIVTNLTICMGLLLVSTNIFAQSVGIGETDYTPSDNAILELKANNKGFLPPRMTEMQRMAINPSGEDEIGLIVYQTDGMAGSYVWTGSTWTVMNAIPVGAIQGFMSKQDPEKTGWAPMSDMSTVPADKFPAFAALIAAVPALSTSAGTTTITIPDWNTDKRFIRGSNTPGTAQDDDTAIHGKLTYKDAWVSFWFHGGSNTRYKNARNTLTGKTEETVYTSSEDGDDPVELTQTFKARPLTSTDTETRPINYSVIWHVYVGLPVN